MGFFLAVHLSFARVHTLRTYCLVYNLAKSEMKQDKLNVSFLWPTHQMTRL